MVIHLQKFTVPADMEGRLRKAIKNGKVNEAVGRDGAHVEMLQVDQGNSATPDIRVVDDSRKKRAIPQGLGG